MAKKQETKKVEVKEPQVQEEVIVQTTVVKEKPLPTPENTWEIKERNYYLTCNQSPLSYSIRTSN